MFIKKALNKDDGFYSLCGIGDIALKKLKEP